MGEPLLPNSTEEENSFIDAYCNNVTTHISARRISLDVSAPAYTHHPSQMASQEFIDTSLNHNRRTQSAPCLLRDFRDQQSGSNNDGPNSQFMPSIVKLASIGVILYMAVGISIYLMKSKSFKGYTTYRVVDAMYFTVATLCTIGYGDIVPNTDFAKLFTCAFILVGFGFIDALLNRLVTYILDKQEAMLLSTVDESQQNAVFNTYIMNMEKGRMRVRMKVGLALCVASGCIALGTIAVHLLEDLNWIDSFYLSVTSVTTVGYGDYAFQTPGGRLFAAVWLLISTLAVTRAFLYLIELTMDKRNHSVARWVLQKKLTAGDLVAADLDNDGCVSKSDFVVYKLKQMGKVSENDILEICNQFDKLDMGNYGKLKEWLMSNKESQRLPLV